MRPIALPPPYLSHSESASSSSSSYAYAALGIAARLAHWLLMSTVPAPTDADVKPAKASTEDVNDSHAVRDAARSFRRSSLSMVSESEEFRSEEHSWSSSSTDEGDWQRSSCLTKDYHKEFVIPNAGGGSAHGRDKIGGNDAGLPPLKEPLVPRRSAVVVIDVQPIWSSSEPIVTNFPHLGGNVRSLLARARANGMPVVHVRASYDNSPHVALLRRNAPELNRAGRIDPYATEEWARELPGEHVVFKSSFNAFDKTSLETLLKECLGVERVYLCGLVTSACVLSTALGAFSCGIEPVIVEDCVADRTRERHEAALALWDHYVFRVCCSWKDVFAAEAPMARSPIPARRSDHPGQSDFSAQPVLCTSGPSVMSVDGELKLDFGVERISPSSTLVDLQGHEARCMQQQQQQQQPDWPHARAVRGHSPVPPPNHIGRKAVDGDSAQREWFELFDDLETETVPSEDLPCGAPSEILLEPRQTSVRLVAKV